MKQRTIIFLSLLFLLQSCTTIPDIELNDLDNSENLLLNSSYELGQFDRNLMPLGWFTVIDEPGVVFWDSFNARSGERSLKIRSVDESVEIISESFPISPKNIYYINCFAKAAKSRQAAIKFAFMAFDKKGKKVNYYYDIFYPEDSWTEFGLRTDFLSDNARFARVIIILPERAGTDFWLDDIGCYIAHKFTK